MSRSKFSRLKYYNTDRLSGKYGRPKLKIVVNKSQEFSNNKINEPNNICNNSINIDKALSENLSLIETINCISPKENNLPLLFEFDSFSPNVSSVKGLKLLFNDSHSLEIKSNEENQSTENFKKSNISEIVEKNITCKTYPFRTSNKKNITQKRSFIYKLDKCYNDSFMQTQKYSEVSNAESIQKKISEILEKDSSVSSCQNITVDFPLQSSADYHFNKITLNSNNVWFYGLPPQIMQLLKDHKNVTDLYDWQKECLELPALKARKNLIYCLPTSGGKTLVAEILLLRELKCFKKNVLMVLPYISLVQEKIKSLTVFSIELDFLIEEYAASKGIFPPKKHRKNTVYVATIEKAHSILNSMLESNRVTELGMVVVDELHMIGEKGGRGACLEIFLTKILYCQFPIQIIGMSATLGNLKELSLFLKAEIYQCDFRPVNLTEYIKIEDKLYKIGKSNSADEFICFDRCCKASYSEKMKSLDPDMLMSLVMEVIPQHSVLLFCSTKKNCENVAKMLSKLLPRDLLEYSKDDKEKLCQSLIIEGNGAMCPILKKTIPFGIAYHHAGLTMAERRFLEDSYMDGTLNILCCTSTLAAGVNLPAKRVIIRAPYVGTDMLSLAQYKQMVGRAGRTGLSSNGDSILICRCHEWKKILEILQSESMCCESSLNFERENGLNALIISTIGLSIASTASEVSNFLHSTLLAVQKNRLNLNLQTLLEAGLNVLKKRALIRSENEFDNSPVRGNVSACQPTEKFDLNDKLVVTRIGKAAVQGSINTDIALQLYKDLSIAQRTLVLSTYLHLLYIVIPYDFVPKIPFNLTTFNKAYNSLEPEYYDGAKILGMTEGLLIKKMSGQKLQSLHEFWAFRLLLPSFTQQLFYCTTVELIPLLELPSVKKGRARLLYNAGYRTLKDIAVSDPKDLQKKVKYIPSKVASQIVTSAKMLLLAQIESLRDEADMIANAINIKC